MTQYRKGVGEVRSLTELLQRNVDTSQGAIAVVLGELLRTARRHLNMEIGFISRFEDGRRVFRYVDEDQPSGLLRVGAGDPLEETYCQRVADGRLPELMTDAQKWPAAVELPVTRELGIHAHVSVPVRLSDGSVYGTFCCFSRYVDRSLNKRDMTLIHIFADFAARLLEKEAPQIEASEAKRHRVQATLDNDDIRMVWQPILCLNSEAIVGLEALARFPGQPPHITTGTMFDEAAEVGLNHDLEMRAVEKGLAIAKRLPDDVYVSVNVSAHGLMSHGFADRLNGFKSRRVVLELTEHSLVGDYDALHHVLEPLRKELGVAVDDAGAGYATLRHILRLRPDIIKLDRDLVQNLDADNDRWALTAALARFADEIGCDLVAEGIETRAELEALKALGVPYGQGYFLHKPLPEAEVHRLTVNKR